VATIDNRVDTEPVGTPMDPEAPPGSAPLGASAVTRRFGECLALDDVSLTLASGEVHVLYGPHGAGKTTLMRILAGFGEPTEGSVSLHGACARSRVLRTRIGFVPHGDRGFYPRLSGLENLAFFARLYGLRRRDAIARATELLTSVGLAEEIHRPVGDLPLAMRRRLAIAQAMLKEPEALLLDDPTSDLDAQGAQRVRLLVSWIASHGTSVLWSTANAEEIRGFADRVTFLSESRVHYSGPVAALSAPGGTPRYVLRLRSSAPLGPIGRARLQRVIGQSAIVTLPRADDPEWVIVQPRAQRSVGEAIAALVQGGFAVLSCRQAGSDLEEGLLEICSETPA